MAAENQILITGGYGCIGAETARWLLRNTLATVIIGSREVSDERTHRLFHDVDTTRLKCIRLDVRNQQELENILLSHQITHVVHLAALQTPDCNANRDLGLQINLGGTQNLIEAIKKCVPSLRRFVFASSVAVYGPRSAYPAGKVPMLANPSPVNVYGIWKLAGEHIARLFCNDTGIPTVCIRPGVLFGPGRDAGLTAATTTAMKHVVCGTKYEIPFRSRQDYLYAPDVGAAVANDALEPFEGYGVFTLPGHSVETATIIDHLRTAAKTHFPDLPFSISCGTNDVPFICDLEYQPFIDAFPGTPHTPLDIAIRESLQRFRQQKDRGWLIG
jgi:nucleoside-diphosphate-sugar epimerase